MKRSLEIAFLVDGLGVELGGGGDGAADEGAAPDEGDGAGAAVLAAPAADHVVVEVDLPVRVVLGEDVGEVGLGLEVGWLAAGRQHVGDVAEQLQRPLRPSARAEPGTQTRPPQARSGNQSISAGTSTPAGRSSSSAQAFPNASASRSAKRPCGIPSWVLSAMKRGIGRGFGGIGRDPTRRASRAGRRRLAPGGRR